MEIKIRGFIPPEEIGQERKRKVSIWVDGPIGAADAEQMPHLGLVSLVFTARAKL